MARRRCERLVRRAPAEALTDTCAPRPVRVLVLCRRGRGWGTLDLLDDEGWLVMTDPSSEIRQVMTHEVVAVGEKLSLRSLAAVLAELDIGAALVEAPDGAVAVVSERDVVRAIAEGADPDVVWTIDVAAPQLVAAEPQESVADVARRMTAESIRHLAVVEHGVIVGVVSVRDVLPVLTESVGST